MMFRNKCNVQIYCMLGLMQLSLQFERKDSQIMWLMKYWAFLKIK